MPLFLHIVGVARRVRLPSPIKFVAALLRVAGAVFRREDVFVPNWVMTGRQKICHENDGKCYVAEIDQCQECTCFVGLKSTLATEKCPKKFW